MHSICSSFHLLTSKSQSTPSAPLLPLDNHKSLCCICEPVSVLCVCVCVCVCVLAAQSCLTLCDPTECSLPVFSVHVILQARILEWVAIPFSRGSSWPRDQTQVSPITGRFFLLGTPIDEFICGIFYFPHVSDIVWSLAFSFWLASPNVIILVASLADIFFAACEGCWARGTQRKLPGFLTHRNCEVINIWPFKLLNFWGNLLCSHQ